MKLKLFKKTFAIISALSLTLSASAIAANAAEIEEDFVGTEEVTEITENDSSDALPEKFSSLDFGWVTSVKDQDYNDCWAYATLSTLETKLLKEGYTNVDMSETHLNGWATKRSDESGWQRNYTEDGYQNTGLGYLMSWQGGILAQDIGEISLPDVPFSDEFSAYKPRFGVIAAEQVYGTDPENVKRAIYENGSVDSAFAFTQTCLNYDNGAYCLPSNFSGGFSGHAVQIIGWDDNYAVENFKKSFRPQNPGAWLIKNSWGTGTGDGFLWISYEDKYLLGTKYKPSFAIKTVMPITDNVKLMQNEEFGSTYEFAYVENDDITFINRFDFEEDFRTVDKVIFKSEALGSTYTIYYIPDKDGAPDSDESAWKSLYTGTVDYKGYICADIEDEEMPVGNGSIGIRIDSSDIPETSSSIGVGEWLTSKGNYVFLNKSSYGQSYISYDGKMSDLLDWYKTNNDDELGGTFAIKAVVSKSVEKLLGDINLNGKLDISDATTLQMHLAELVELSDEALSVADINVDGRIDINDATTIQKILSDLI